MTYFDNYPPLTAEKPVHVLTEEPYIDVTCTIKDSTVGAWAELGKHTIMIESSFGDYSYTAGNVHIMYAEIGKYCSIAINVRINPSNHPQWRVTQHHMTYRRKMFALDREDDTEFFQWRKDHQCLIGHDVWIGHAAVIMPGVKIGTGAIIGSGAVVTKDVGPYEIAVGIPAKVIKKRFDEETIAKLLASEWWNWDRETLEENFKDLLDIKSFLNKHTKTEW